MSTNLKAYLQPAAQPNAASAALLLIRLIAGVAFVFHGWGKIQNPMAWMGPDSSVPGVFQLLAAVAEFGGGIAWALGALTPIASLGLGVTMIGATYLHLVVMKDPFVSTGGGSYELALLYLGIAALLFVLGPGKFSLDAKLFSQPG